GDATAQERSIQETNTGVVITESRLLKGWLQLLKPRNAQGENYLTDILAQAVKHKCAIATVEAADATEVLGVNDKLPLADGAAAYSRRRARTLMAQGVTLIDPARVDIRGPVTVGRDVQLDVNVVLEGP